MVEQAAILLPKVLWVRLCLIVGVFQGQIWIRDRGKVQGSVTPTTTLCKIARKVGSYRIQWE